VHINRLLYKLDAHVLEAPEGFNRFEHRPGLVRVDPHGDAVTYLVLDRGRQRQVVVEIETDLDVDGLEAARSALGRRQPICPDPG